MAHPYIQQAKSYLARLDKELAKFPSIVMLESATKIPKTYAVVGAASIFSILVLLNVWGNLLTDLLGFVYPAAIESIDPTDDTQWLTYWVVFGIFNVLEYFSDIILHWIPFYYTFKGTQRANTNIAGIILYLVLPQTRGASVVYHKVVRPYLLQDERKIDQAIDRLKAQASSAANELASESSKKSE